MLSMADGAVGCPNQGVVKHFTTPCPNLVENQILKNGMFSNNTAKQFSQRANKYNHAILR
jgi:hypothetical protein